MKYRRFTAVIITLLLLLGMMPEAALAAKQSTDTFCSATTSGKHSWRDWKTTKEPTCTKNGKKERTCGRCGYTQKKTIKKTGHSWGGWKTTKEATCAHSGEKTRKCSRCGEKQTETIKKASHKWGGWKSTKEATCTSAGEKTRKCSVCGKKDTETIQKADHKWSSWKTTKEATCTARGEQSRTCSVCGKKETRETDKLPHTWSEWTVTKAATDFSMGTHTQTCQVCGEEKTEDFYPDPTYKKGDKGDGVKALQEKLNAAGYNCGTADGDFGKKTEAAVKAIEEDHGVTADGIAWPGVQKWLNGTGGYGWEPPEDEEEPEEPEETEEPGGPAGEVSPASLEPSELYDVTVKVEDTSGMKYIMDPVEVHVTFTNTGSEAVDVSCEGIGTKALCWPGAALVACTFGKLYKYSDSSHWKAHLEPSQSSTVTVSVSLTKEDADRGWIERELDAWFLPSEASSGDYPTDWPWEAKQRDLDVSFKIGLGDPALKAEAYGERSTRVGETLKIGITAYNYGPCTLYNYEVDVYEWDIAADDYVFIETLGPSDQIKSPRPIAPNYYWFWGLSKEINVTKQTVADSDNGVLKYAFRARSWTEDGTPVESELVMKEFFVYYAGVHLEAEDTSAGQVISEDGNVKVKLTATNIGTEVMMHHHTICKRDESHSIVADYYLDYYTESLYWLTPGTSADTELSIKVYDEDIKARKVRRLLSLEFRRMSGKDGKTLPPDSTDGISNYNDYAFYTNEVEVVIPLLNPSTDPPVTPVSEPESKPQTEPSIEPQVTLPPVLQPLAYCVPALTGLGDGVAEWTLTRCPEHYAVVKAANKLLEDAEDDEAKLAAWEAVVQLWTDALNAEYDTMLAGGEKALVEAEKAAFEAQLAAHRAALEMGTSDAVPEQIAGLLMGKTAEICYERHTAPDDGTPTSEALPAAGYNDHCQRSTYEMGATLRVAETLCAEHRAIAAAAGSDEEAKKAWLDALDAQTNARWLGADEAGRALIADERQTFGDWLEAREALLNALYPDQPAVTQKLLSQAIRARVLENCGEAVPCPLPST